MSSKKIGTKFEREFARDMNARLVPGSGCLPFAKADVIGQVFLTECKASTTGSVRVPLEWINKIMFHAKHHERLWSLAVQPRQRALDKYLVITDIFDEIEYTDAIPLPVMNGKSVHSFLVTPELANDEWLAVRYLYNGGEFSFSLLGWKEFQDLDEKIREGKEL